MYLETEDPGRRRSKKKRPGVQRHIVCSRTARCALGMVGRLQRKEPKEGRDVIREVTGQDLGQC